MGCNHIIDVRVRQYSVDEANQRYSGLAFVHFLLTPEGVYALKRATHRLGSVCVEQINFDTGISMNLEKILRNRPDLNIKYIPEGHTFEPSFISRKANKNEFDRQHIAMPPLPFVSLAVLDHLIVERLPVAVVAAAASTQQTYMQVQNGFVSVQAP
eukprot:gene23978-30264_t